MPNFEDISPVVDRIDEITRNKQVPVGYSNDFWGGLAYVRNLLNSQPNSSMSNESYLALLKDIEQIVDSPYANQTDVRYVLDYVYHLLNALYNKYSLNIPDEQ